MIIKFLYVTCDFKIYSIFLDLVLAHDVHLLIELEQKLTYDNN